MTLSIPIPHTSLYANVAVIFIDIAGFVAHTSALTDSQRVAMLHNIYAIFDDTAAQHDAKIIKYLGDGCLLLCGPYFSQNTTILSDQNSTANNAISLSIALQQRLSYPTKYAITCGDIMAGYIGINQSQFDIWGRIVDHCSRILGTTPSNAIYVCHNTAQYHSLPIQVSKHHLELRDFGDTCVYQIHH